MSEKEKKRGISCNQKLDLKNLEDWYYPVCDESKYGDKEVNIGGEVI